MNIYLYIVTDHLHTQFGTGSHTPKAPLLSPVLGEAGLWRREEEVAQAEIW